MQRTTNGKIPGLYTTPGCERGRPHCLDQTCGCDEDHRPHWPSATIAVANVVFLIATAPMLLGPDKPPLYTSAATGLLLLAVAASLRRLGARWGAAATGALGLAWLWVAGQTLGCLP